MRRVNNEVEIKIATAAVVSTAFCAEMKMIYRPYMIKVQFLRTIIDWCMEYFEEYEKAPGEHIEDLFNIYESSLKEGEAELIERTLEKLSGEYDEKGINIPFVIDQTRSYFELRYYEWLTGEAKRFVRTKDIESVKEILNKPDPLSAGLTSIFNPLSDETIDKFEKWREEGVDTLFGFDGCLGELFGDFRRGWLVGFMGPMKRGKSNWLLEMAVQAAYNKKNVFFASFEMSEEDLLERIYKRITGLPDSRHKYIFPVFDCQFNQINQCQKKCRVGKGQLFEREDLDDIFTSDGRENPYAIFERIVDMEDYDKVRGYRTCDVCRGTGDYLLSVWYKEVLHPASMTIGNIRKKAKRLLEKICGDRLRFKAYPAYSAGLSEVKSAMESLSTRGFDTDVLITDYADIMNPEVSYRDPRHNIDHVWKGHKQIAAERRCLVVTASQSNRGSISKKSIEQEDTGEDIRKLAHVDVFASLNQTRKERAIGIMRLGIIAHRHSKFNEARQVVVLQQLDIGQPALDFERAF